LASGYEHVIGLSCRACGCPNLSVRFYGNPKTLVFWRTKNAEVLSKSQHIHWHYYWYGNLPWGAHPTDSTHVTLEQTRWGCLGKKMSSVIFRTLSYNVFLTHFQVLGPKQITKQLNLCRPSGKESFLCTLSYTFLVRCCRKHFTKV